MNKSHGANMLSHRAFLVSLACSATLLSAAAVTGAQDSAGKQGTLIIVPHTHWEGAVFKTRDEYLVEGLPHIAKALALMQRYPDYRYVLDQMAYVRPFLERYPDQVPLVKRMLDERRLEIAGGTLVMEDENLPSGESLARHF